MGLVSRKTGKLYMEQVEHINEKTLCGLISKNVSSGAHICSDELRGYQPLSKRYDFTHSTVCHSRREYARYDEDIEVNTHTNTIEGVWSHLEKFINGVMIDVGHQFIDRYLGEFMMRYNFRHLNNLWGQVLGWCG